MRLEPSRLREPGPKWTKGGCVCRCAKAAFVQRRFSSSNRHLRVIELPVSTFYFGTPTRIRTWIRFGGVFDVFGNRLDVVTSSLEIRIAAPPLSSGPPEPEPVPEPATLVLLALGLVALAATRYLR